MTVTTTLKALRDKSVRVRGYNRLVRTLQGEEFTRKDAGRGAHIRYEHKEPIPLRTILDSNGLDDALWSLRACDQTPEMVRAERLFAVWCARQVQHLMTDQRSLDALDVAERHAHGNATDEQLDAARAAAEEAAEDAEEAAEGDAEWAAAWAAAWTAGGDAAWDAAWAAARDAAWAAEWAAAEAEEGDEEGDAAGSAAWAAACDAQNDMFIAVFCGDQINIDAMKEI